MQSPSVPRSVTPSIYPHFREYSAGGTIVELEYLERLAPGYSDKAIFKALAKTPTETATVVVKFTHQYGREGHELLADKTVPPLAPKLRYCERVENVGTLVVIMDFVDGRKLEAILQGRRAGELKRAVKALHEQDLVFGDLRRPNVMIPKDSDGIMLIDFDWCGKVGKAHYPLDVFLDSETTEWHEGTRRGGEITKEHDRFMLDYLVEDDL